MSRTYRGLLSCTESRQKGPDHHTNSLAPSVSGKCSYIGNDQAFHGYDEKSCSILIFDQLLFAFAKQIYVTTMKHLPCMHPVQEMLTH